MVRSENEEDDCCRGPNPEREMALLVRELLPLVTECINQERVLKDERLLADLGRLTVLFARLLGGRTPDAPASPERSRLDEYIEDMIDPEFGLKPARMAIERAAEIILDSAAANVPWDSRLNHRRRS